MAAMDCIYSRGFLPLYALARLVVTLTQIRTGNSRDIRLLCFGFIEELWFFFFFLVARRVLITSAPKLYRTDNRPSTCVINTHNLCTSPFHSFFQPLLLLLLLFLETETEQYNYLVIWISNVSQTIIDGKLKDSDL